VKTDIADRENVFYWQTDRAVTPQEAGEIWADRHRYFTDREILTQANGSTVSSRWIPLPKRILAM